MFVKKLGYKNIFSTFVLFKNKKGELLIGT